MNIGKNYTRPDDENYEDKPEDWLFLSIAFSRALSRFLADGQGVIIDSKGGMLEIKPDVKRIIIFNDGEQMRIVDGSERTDLKDGTLITMVNGDILSN